MEVINPMANFDAHKDAFPHAKLTRSPDFQGRPDRAEVEEALDRIAQRIVVQPDWGDDRRRLPSVATERIPVAASGVPSRHEPNRNIP